MLERLSEGLLQVMMREQMAADMYHTFQHVHMQKVLGVNEMRVHSNYYEDHDEYERDLAFEYRSESGSTGWSPIGIKQRPYVDDTDQMTLDEWLEIESGDKE